MPPGIGYGAAAKFGLSALIGAGVGGAYGALSDRTSVLGGMLGGAALGAGGYAGARLGKAGMRGYSQARAAGFGTGLSAYMGVNRMGRLASRYIGSTARKAYNHIPSTLQKGSSSVAAAAAPSAIPSTLKSVMGSPTVPAAFMPVMGGGRVKAASSGGASLASLRPDLVGRGKRMGPVGRHAWNNMASRVWAY